VPAKAGDMAVVRAAPEYGVRSLHAERHGCAGLAQDMKTAETERSPSRDENDIQGLTSDPLKTRGRRNHAYISPFPHKFFPSSLGLNPVSIEPRHKSASFGDIPRAIDQELNVFEGSLSPKLCQ
jgi:hypothetical protein